MPDTKPLAPRDILARTMKDGRDVLIPHIAEMLRREGIAEVPSDEERRRFWQAALTDEQEQQMWAQAMIARGITQLIPGSPEAIDIGLGIAKAKYPDRFDMMGQEGRDHASQQALWAMRHAKAGPPTPKADEMQTAQPTGLSAVEDEGAY
jgi:hypothetical protein